MDVVNTDTTPEIQKTSDLTEHKSTVGFTGNSSIKDSSEKQLPQTGEQESRAAIAGLGLMIISMFGLVGVSKKRKQIR